MIIRQASALDARGIYHLLGQLGYPAETDTFVSDKIEQYANDGYCLLVAERSSDVIGFIAMHWSVQFHSSGFSGRVTALCVDDELRGKGIGKKLLAAAEEILFSKGCAKIEVTSNNSRTQTHKFYTDNGYLEDSKKFVKKRGSQM